MSSSRIGRRLANAVGAVALWGVASLSVAAPLTGDISSTGTTCLWADAATAVATAGTGCQQISVNDANYFDFIAYGGTTKSPGTNGQVIFGTGTSDFTSILFVLGDPTSPVGSITDFSFATTGDITDFVLWSVIGRDGNTYQYTLESISGVERDTGNKRLAVSGLGTLCILEVAGSCNTFNMNLTTQYAGDARTTTFSLSQAAVPEPGTLALLGLGLAGLGFAARRRQS